MLIATESHIPLSDVNADEESTRLFAALLTMASLWRVLEFTVYAKRYGLAHAGTLDRTHAHVSQDKSLTTVRLVHSVSLQS